MAKKEFKWWKRECVDAWVVENTPTKLVISFLGIVPSKKNSKRAFRWIVLPSENYVERHKRMMKILWWTKWEYNSFPCTVEIVSIAWDRVHWDVDNTVTSFFDLFTDLWIIEDDNKFIINKVSSHCLGYRKNYYVHTVTITPSDPMIDDNEDYKDKLKSFINN